LAAFHLRLAFPGLAEHRTEGVAGVANGERVTAGALRLAVDLRGDEVTQAIQLYMQYAPEPPFRCGTPETAPPAILAGARRAVHALTEQRGDSATGGCAPRHHRCCIKIDRT
jgi:hypothetical protein